MKLAYFDCFSGISGEMLLGALVDAGCSLPRVEEQLRPLTFSGWRFSTERVSRRGLAATRVIVITPPLPFPILLNDILQMIGGCALPAGLTEKGASVFCRLAESEAVIQDIPVETVQFYGEPAARAILETLSVLAGFAQLGIGEFACSAINLNGADDRGDGISPVKKSVIQDLLREVPTNRSGHEAAVVTRVGAAIAATLASQFGPLPAMTISSVGMGAGAAEFAERANIFRLFVGEESAVGEAWTNQYHGCLEESLVVLETSLDDLNPQTYGYLAEIALRQGALDVYAAPGQMKHNRPGLVVSILCKLSTERHLTDLLFRESNALVVRRKYVQRRSLMREQVTVETAWGPVRVKIARNNRQVLNIAPEYEDCKQVAERHSVPLKNVLAEAAFQFRRANRE